MSIHGNHAKRCLMGLPSSQVDLDGSRMAASFYCLGILDLVGQPPTEGEDWIWEHQHPEGGFTPSHFSPGSPAHIIMTYTALMSLCILRSNFEKLDRKALVRMLGACQQPDGSFSTLPGGAGDTDLRTLYCAAAVAHMVGDFSSIDIPRATAFVARCRSHQGGYGQAPHTEAHAGLTYVALAALSLLSPSQPILTPSERAGTIHFLLSNQSPAGGFSGRTAKPPDACYNFWSVASLRILGAHSLVCVDRLRAFTDACAFRYGGIAKSPGEMPDPYHTYLALAALAVFDEDEGEFDVVLNARHATAAWARKMVKA